MGEPYLAEIRIISFNFAPKGWALCNGQILPINQNQALFSLLGTTYGGNGQTTFALPDFRGRIPVHVGSGIVLGQAGGEEQHTLSLAEMPMHTHIAQGSSSSASLPSPANNTWGRQDIGLYSATPNTTMNPTVISSAGGGQPHNNLPPYLVLNFIIALTGIFPSRN